MIITCPSCNRKYSVSESKLPDGKKVKCTVCQSTWEYHNDNDSVMELNALQETNKPIVRHGDHVRVKYSGGQKWLSAGCIFLSFFLMIGFFIFRDYIATYVPQSTEIYELLNLNYRILEEPLEITNISYLNDDAGVSISGDIINHSNSEEVVSDISIKIIPNDPNAKGLSFVYKVPNEKIFSKGKIHFSTEKYNIPFNGFNIEVKFYNKSDINL